MDDDFNTAGALGYLFELVRAINHARDLGVGTADVESAQSLILELTSVLGLHLEVRTEPGIGEAAPFVDLLVEVRSELRNEKLWALSDRIRDKLMELDVIIEDNKDGTTWRWK
jgi:cysteinyl-tRNA synthetase